jgi:CDP-diacylglycerol--serine O-phosphatidyltransferase
MAKLSKHIPNSMTIFNIAIGLASILLSLSGEYVKAAGLIIVSVIVDCFDGYVARLLRSTSRIGGYMDVLSDFISFGLATAILMYKVFNIHSSVVVFYVFSSGFRLIYFMKTKNKSFFNGVPTTTSGGFLASTTIYHLFDTVTANYVVLILSLLMLSQIKYYRIDLSGRRTISTLLAIMLALFVLDFMLAVRAISFVFLGYIAFGWLKIREVKDRSPD